MHRYRLLPPLHENVPKPPARVELQIAYIVFRGMVGIGFFGHGFLSAFTGGGLKDFATNFQTTFGVLPFHWMYAWVVGLGYAIPFVHMVVGVLLLLGLLTRQALVVGYFLLIMALIEVIVLRAWVLTEQVALCFMAVTMLLLGQHRFDASWKTLFRRSG